MNWIFESSRKRVTRNERRKTMSDKEIKEKAEKRRKRRALYRAFCLKKSLEYQYKGHWLYQHRTEILKDAAGAMR